MPGACTGWGAGSRRGNKAVLDSGGVPHDKVLMPGPGMRTMSWQLAVNFTGCIGLQLLAVVVPQAAAAGPAGTGVAAGKKNAVSKQSRALQ